MYLELNQLYVHLLLIILAKVEVVLLVIFQVHLVCLELA